MFLSLIEHYLLQFHIVSTNSHLVYSIQQNRADTCANVNIMLDDTKFSFVVSDTSWLNMMCQKLEAWKSKKQGVSLHNELAAEQKLKHSCSNG